MSRAGNVLLALVISVWVALSARLWFVCDDAWITFRFSRNWASGHGLRYNLGDHVPVEGYSNFLWMCLAAACEVVGVSPGLVLPIVSIATGAALLLSVAMTVYRLTGSEPAGLLSALILCLSPSMAVWATSGLATMPLALCLWLTWERLVVSTSSRAFLHAGLAGCAMVLLRTEGIAWFGVVVILALAAAVLNERSRLRGIGQTLGFVVGVYALYFGWRYGVFGTLVSNTAKAKVSLSSGTMDRGFEYLAAYGLATIAPAMWLLFIPLAIRRIGFAALTCGLMAIAPPTYAVVVGGDFMAMGRLFVPGLAFSAAIVGIAVASNLTRSLKGVIWTGVIVTIAGVGQLPAWDMHVVPQSTRAEFHFRHNTPTFRSEFAQWRFMNTNAQRWARVGRGLAQVAEPGDSYVEGAIGAVGYHSDLFIWDRYGLVTREVADLPDQPHAAKRHSPGHDKGVEREWFLNREPTFFRADLVRSRAAAARRVTTWRAGPRVQKGYVPEVFEVDVTGPDKHLVVLRLARDGENVEQIWSAFLRQKR